MFPPCCGRPAKAECIGCACARSTEIAGPGGEDLVNAAVVETLRAGGEVFMLPQDKMQAAHPLAAILRY